MGDEESSQELLNCADNGGLHDVLTGTKNNNGGTSIKKRKYKYTKSELKKRRQKRAAKGPWGSWSESDEDSADGIEKESGQHDMNTEIMIESDDDSDIPYEPFKESSQFYGDAEKDYQGRGIIHPPIDVGTSLNKPPLSFKCFLPKKIKYAMDGHTNGTTSLTFLPNSGNLLLSGGNDNIVKVWDFYHKRNLLRDYKGHSKAINSLDFNDDGTNFISSSFDHTIKIWDTEQGKVKTKLHFKSTPNDVKFRPFNSSEFIVGFANSKIYHYDTRISENDGRVQVYDHHMSSILALKFFPDGSKFISSSEDKTVRIWDNQVNVPIKQISDTTQYSMPSIDIHPDKKNFCAQSMDNTIYTYSMKPKYRRNPNKMFKGQTSAGYGIGLTFSADGRYVCSGDSKSKVHIWDWTTTRLLNTISIPGNKPITQVAWNPQETSKVACSGNTGKIYILD
ncbi:hypothetical protein NCAS_0F03340 [Naumovozyma castellii]|uniref:Pre-mRNA-processing factor 17 n=1 Tax=Naumovozyma castellii TaxID=27288 RepID=G0VH46_NAUCA|nr:hypothetical protein NCAS_0F03340 [Naumovozyma castellii CBS 4309]CCC70818.1 hypothetical protein NCAS_0F03340 [Naumovozyma castellii CBS 4309]